MLFVTLSLAMLMLPMGLGLLLVVFLPLLPALHVVRRGFANAAGFSLLTVGALSFLGDAAGMLPMIFFSCIGLGLGRGFRGQVRFFRSPVGRRVRSLLNSAQLPQFAVRSSAETFLQGFCGAVVGILLMIALAPMLTQMTLVGFVDATFVESIRMVQELPGSFDLSLEQAAEMAESLQFAREAMRDNFTSILFCAALLIVFPAFMLAHPIVQRFGGMLPPLPSFRFWRLPNSLAYVLCLTLIPLLIIEDTSQFWLLNMVAGVNQLLFLVCVFQGMAVADFFLFRWRCPRWLRYLLRPLLFLIPQAQQLMLLLGLVDVGVDLRKLRTPPGKSKNSA